MSNAVTPLVLTGGKFFVLDFDKMTAVWLRIYYKILRADLYIGSFKLNPIFRL